MLWWTLRKLHATAPQTRAAAAEVLGYSRDQRAVSPLMAALQDEYAALRIAAAEALGATRRYTRRGPLVAALQDEYREVRQGAAWALGWLGDARAVEPLRGALGDSHAVPEAAVALIRLGHTAETSCVAAWEDDVRTGLS